ncbi:uncharacterized protein J3D65DRAFT_610465 [Phyllosticta citribraziliensis]|uniref:Uncharacterized protein n=1 Tax=Phyllosticta citribraziliensis TaxID=989973 RepID=A0ABR1MBU4_9PEZI
MTRKKHGSGNKRKKALEGLEGPKKKHLEKRRKRKKEKTTNYRRGPPRIIMPVWWVVTVHFRDAIPAATLRHRCAAWSRGSLFLPGGELRLLARCALRLVRNWVQARRALGLVDRLLLILVLVHISRRHSLFLFCRHAWIRRHAAHNPRFGPARPTRQLRVMHFASRLVSSRLARIGMYHTCRIPYGLHLAFPVSPPARCCCCCASPLTLPCLPCSVVPFVHTHGVCITLRREILFSSLFVSSSRI